MEPPLERAITDNQGRRIEATITKVENDHITFQRKGENKTFTIPITTLAEEDQAYFRKMENHLKTVGSTGKDAPDPNQVKKSGNLKIYVIWSEENYVARALTKVWGEHQVDATHVKPTIHDNIDIKKTLSEYDGVYITNRNTIRSNQESLGNKAFFTAVDMNLPVAIITSNSNMDSGVERHLRIIDALAPAPTRRPRSGTIRNEGNIISYTPGFPEGRVWLVCNETYQKAAEKLVELARKNREN